MKKITAIVLAAVALFAFSNVRAEDAKKDGKAIFTASKCTMCHTFDAAGIKKLEKKTDIAGGMAADKVEKYLMQESELNGKKHKTKFKGTPEDLATMAKWIASVKAGKK